MSVTRESWERAWHEAGAPDADAALFDRLVAAYSEPHRHYHTLHHLRDCLALFDEARPDAQHPGEVELALWFHDSVYDPQRKDNEERSADWAMDAALDAGLTGAAAGRLHALVMATRHEAMPEDADAQLLVDVDLAILGSAPDRFDESDRQIRAEYAHVSDEDWKTGRSDVLNKFLARPRLYGTQRFHDRYEQRARDNLQRALARLTG